MVGWFTAGVSVGGDLSPFSTGRSTECHLLSTFHSRPLVRAIPGGLARSNVSSLIVVYDCAAPVTARRRRIADAFQSSGVDVEPEQTTQQAINCFVMRSRLHQRPSSAEPLRLRRRRDCCCRTPKNCYVFGDILETATAP